MSISSKFPFQGKFPLGSRAVKDLKEIQARFISADAHRTIKQNNFNMCLII